MSRLAGQTSFASACIGLLFVILALAVKDWQTADRELAVGLFQSCLGSACHNGTVRVFERCRAATTCFHCFHILPGCSDRRRAVHASVECAVGHTGHARSRHRVHVGWRLDLGHGNAATRRPDDDQVRRDVLLCTRSGCAPGPPCIGPQIYCKYSAFLPLMMSLNARSLCSLPVHPGLELVHTLHEKVRVRSAMVDGRRSDCNCNNCVVPRGDAAAVLRLGVPALQETCIHYHWTQCNPMSCSLVLVAREYSEL